MRRARAERRSEAGETLVELLATSIILGLGVVAVVAAIFAGVKIADDQDRGAAATNLARKYAETLKSQGGTWEYVDCATSYPGPATVPSGYGVTIPDIDYWNGGTSGTDADWDETCSTDQGLQRITVQVTTSGTTNVAKDLTFVKRDARPTT